VILFLESVGWFSILLQPLTHHPMYLFTVSTKYSLVYDTQNAKMQAIKFS